MNVLHGDVINNDPKVAYYCLEEGLIDYIGHILELVGDKGRYTKEIIKILFTVIELIFGNKMKKGGAMIFEMMIKLVFNMKIWSCSEIKVQVSVRVME